MEKYQTRSASSNFLSAADTIDDKVDDTEADTAQVNHSEVNRGDTTSSASLTQNPSEPIQTSTEDLEFKTTPEALEDQGSSQASNEASLDQQLEPLKIADVILPSSELEVQNMSRI